MHSKYFEAVKPVRWWLSDLVQTGLECIIEYFSFVSGGFGPFGDFSPCNQIIHKIGWCSIEITSLPTSIKITITLKNICQLPILIQWLCCSPRTGGQPMGKVILWSCYLGLDNDWLFSSPRQSLPGPEISGPQNNQIVWSLSGPGRCLVLLHRAFVSI